MVVDESHAMFKAKGPSFHNERQDLILAMMWCKRHHSYHTSSHVSNFDSNLRPLPMPIIIRQIQTLDNKNILAEAIKRPLLKHSGEDVIDPIQLL